MISRFLFIILPFALFTGPFLADGILSLVAINYLYKVIKNKSLDFFKNSITIIFLLFYLYILTRSFFSEDILLSLESSLFYIRYLFFVGGVIYIFKYHNEFIRYFFYSSVLSLVFVIFDAILQIYFSINLIGELSPRSDRLGLFEDELIIGSYLTRILIIAIPLYLYLFKVKKVPIFILSCIALVIFIIAYSGERTALFIILFFIFICIFLFDVNFYKKLILAVILIISSFFIIFSNENIKTRLITSTINGFTDDITNQKVIFSKIHDGHFKSAYNMFLDNRLFGHGTKMFRIKCSENNYLNDFSCSTHPHNTYLQLLSETGLIGFLFIFVIFIFYSKLLFQHFLSLIIKQNNFEKFKLNNYQIAIVASLFVTLWPLMPSNNFFNNYISVFYYLPVPVFILFFKDKLQQIKNLYDSV